MTNMDKTRKREIDRYLAHETNDLESQEWRDELTPEELEYVSQLDVRHESSVLVMCSAILVREEVRARFRPEEITELETIQDHCRVRLRDGTMYLARLDRDCFLRLDEIDGVC